MFRVYTRSLKLVHTVSSAHTESQGSSVTFYCNIVWKRNVGHRSEAMRTVKLRPVREVSQNQQKTRKLRPKRLILKHLTATSRKGEKEESIDRLQEQKNLLRDRWDHYFTCLLQEQLQV